jgi:hypothetical protein
MEDLMAKCIEDLTEAEHKVWEGFDVEPREWLLRHGVNVLESIACQRALCDYVTNYGDCGARGMAVARDLGSFMAYAMLYRYVEHALPVCSTGTGVLKWHALQVQPRCHFPAAPSVPSRARGRRRALLRAAATAERQHSGACNNRRRRGRGGRDRAGGLT